MSTYVVTYAGKEIEMPPKEIELLYFLAVGVLFLHDRPEPQSSLSPKAQTLSSTRKGAGTVSRPLGDNHGDPPAKAAHARNGIHAERTICTGTESSFLQPAKAMAAARASR